MQPDDRSQPPQVPDLPDAALPSIDPVSETPPPPQPQQSPQPHHKGQDNSRGQSHLSHIGRKYFKFIEFDDKEILLGEIRKHPFGLLVIFLSGALIAAAIFFGIVIMVASGFLRSLGLNDFDSVAVFASFLLALIVLGITFVNAHLYRNNVVFITNEKVAQVLFISLFSRKISQLSIGDVQDVTVHQDGFLANAFGYGTLVIETAGEQQNYTFTFVPNPYENSKLIINAHESNLKLYGN